MTKNLHRATLLRRQLAANERGCEFEPAEPNPVTITLDLRNLQ